MHIFKFMKRLIKNRRFFSKKTSKKSKKNIDQQSDEEINSSCAPINYDAGEVRITQVYHESEESSPSPSLDTIVSSKSKEIVLPVPDISTTVKLVKFRLSTDSKLSGTVMVANLAYHKNIFVRWTVNNWATYQDTVASHDDSSEGFSHDWFTFTIDSDSVCKDTDGGVCVELAVAYQVNGMEFWDNNVQQNYVLKKESSPQTASNSSSHA